MVNMRTNQTINLNFSQYKKITNDHLVVTFFNEFKNDNYIINTENKAANNQMHIKFTQKFKDDFPEDALISITVTQKQLLWQNKQPFGQVKDIQVQKNYDLSFLVTDRPSEKIKPIVSVSDGSMILGRFNPTDRDEGSWDPGSMKELLIYEFSDKSDQWMVLDQEAGDSSQGEPSILLINNKIKMNLKSLMKHELTHGMILPHIFRIICQKHLNYIINNPDDCEIERILLPTKDDDNDDEIEAIYPADCGYQWEKWLLFIKHYSSYEKPDYHKLCNSITNMQRGQSDDYSIDEKIVSTWLQASIDKLSKDANKIKKITPEKVSKFFRSEE